MLRAGLWPGCTCRHSAPRNAALLFWRAGFAQDSGDEYEGDPAREKMFLEVRRAGLCAGGLSRASPLRRALTVQPVRSHCGPRPSASGRR